MERARTAGRNGGVAAKMRRRSGQGGRTQVRPAPDACVGPGPAGSHHLLRPPSQVGAARQGGGVPQLGGWGECALLSAGRDVGAQGVAVVPPGVGRDA